jgi:hypothetical protein
VLFVKKKSKGSLFANRRSSPSEKSACINIEGMHIYNVQTVWKLYSVFSLPKLPLGGDSFGIGCHFYCLILAVPCSASCDRIATRAASMATHAATSPQNWWRLNLSSAPICGDQPHPPTVGSKALQIFQSLSYQAKHSHDSILNEQDQGPRTPLFESRWQD